MLYISNDINEVYYISEHAFLSVGLLLMTFERSDSNSNQTEENKWHIVFSHDPCKKGRSISWQITCSYRTYLPPSPAMQPVGPRQVNNH